MDTTKYFDKLDALAIMAMKFSKDAQQSTDVEPSEITWEELFVFIVSKCYVSEGFSSYEHDDEMTSTYIKIFNEESEFMVNFHLVILEMMGVIKPYKNSDIIAILNALKMASTRLTPSEFIAQHENNLPSMLWWLARFIGKIKFRVPKPYEIPMRMKSEFNICRDHSKMVVMYRYGLVDSPVDMRSYNYIVKYLIWRTELSEEIIHQYLAHESYEMFETVRVWITV